MSRTTLLVSVVLSLTVPPLTGAEESGSTDLPRTASGHPDLSGFYDTATITPLQRPEIYGDSLYLTPEQAREIEQAEAYRRAHDPTEQGGADRGAPPVGGDGSQGSAGNVGGYNTFWVDPGDKVFMIDGKFRTSIITDPANGRFPPLTEEARARTAHRPRRRQNTGEAYWVHEGDGSGPYDNMEQRSNAERCILGFGSTAGPPMLSVLYNNQKRIVQTGTHVMILTEMVHDARIVRLDSEHAPQQVRRALGDAIGWWEGDTLVVETTNFTEHPSLFSASENLRVTERFTPLDNGDLRYAFTVEDPTVWTSSWSGEYRWPRSDEKVYEYACQEGNYALGNIMRGARLLEAEAMRASATD